MELEIWSDVACPWCYIGKRRIETALQQFEQADEVNVTWRSFELDPSAPAVIEQSAPEHLARKYGMTPEQAEQSQDRLTALAAADGLQYDLSGQRLGSTFDAHRMIHLAAEYGLQDEMKERLLKARLGEGQLISDQRFLLQAATAVGVPEEEVRDVLAGDRFVQAVREDERTAQELGISGVPMFVVDRRYGASGAQEPAELLALLRHGWDNRVGS